MATTDRNNQTTVTNSAAKIVDGDPNAPSDVFLLNTDGAVAAYWGYSITVSSTTGVKLAAGAGQSVPLGPGEAVYMVTAASTAVVCWARARRFS